jgi:hypothetical protein
VAQMWAALLIKTDRLTLEEAAKLALSLRDEQLKQFGPVMREAGVLTELSFDGEGVVAGRQRAVVRAYGSLGEGQRRLLEAGGSVSAAAMPQPARRWLQAALAWGGHSPARGMGQGGMLPEGLSLTVTSRAPTGLATEVRFRYETGLGGVEEFRIALPRAFPAARLVPDPRRPQ